MSSGAGKDGFRSFDGSSERPPPHGDPGDIEGIRVVMSFSMTSITVDGTLRNPFVAVAMALLCVVSFLVAYRLACGASAPGRYVALGIFFLVLVAFTEGWIHVLTNWIYVLYYFDGRLQVGFVGGHSEWLAQCAAAFGLIVGGVRSRYRQRQCGS